MALFLLDRPRGLLLTEIAVPRLAAPRVFLRAIETAFWITGIVLLGWCLYAWVDARLYQSAQTRALDRLESGAARSRAERPVVESASAAAEAAAGADRTLDPLLIGKIDIPRLSVSAIVREGVDDETLRRAVGHIPGTALPKQVGNMAFAGHRDSFFRPLRKIAKDDEIRLRTPSATYTYKVTGTEVVWPEDTRVLDSDGRASLTLITCWPFDYVGNAPRRFIVHARRIGD